MRHAKSAKRKTNRLSLRRETLRELAGHGLRRVVGGGVEPSPFLPSGLLIPTTYLFLGTGTIDEQGPEGR